MVEKKESVILLCVNLRSSEVRKLAVAHVPAPCFTGESRGVSSIVLCASPFAVVCTDLTLSDLLQVILTKVKGHSQW